MWDYLLFSGMFFLHTIFHRDYRMKWTACHCSLDIFLFIIARNAVKSSGWLVWSAVLYLSSNGGSYYYVCVFIWIFIARPYHPLCHYLLPCGKDIYLNLFLSLFSLFHHLPILFPFCSFSLLCYSYFSSLSLSPEAIHVSEGFSLSHWFPANPSLWARHSKPLTPLRWFTQAVIA